MRNLLSTIALAALLAGLTTKAEATEGWYGRVDAGYSVDGQLTAFSSDFDLDDDWMASGGFGYGFQNGFRAEGELAYRSNEVDLFSEDAEVWAGMANLYYDFNRGGRFQPYVGAGIGYGQLDFASLDDSGMAWQAMVGIGIAMGERTTLDIGYRHFELEDLELDLDGPTDVDYEHDAVTVGLRWQFGAAAAPPPPPPPPPPPAPPPPPPPAACPAADFVVYFEWDRSNLNQAALETIDAAVNRARQCNVGGVVVVGHTDSSGSTRYNEGLSERLANVVREALVARGIAGGMITTQARGETDLARATGDGVREPLNRRTAVTISFH
jgi:outer membrane protein OmpA-like peptidoglycan-associated protein